MSILLSYQPDGNTDEPLFGNVAFSESYEEVVDAACEMWGNYLPPHNPTNGRHLAQQSKLPDSKVVWVRFHKSLFANIVRSTPQEGLQLRLQIDKAPAQSYDPHVIFNSPIMLDTTLPSLSSGSGSLNSREYDLQDEPMSNTNNLLRPARTPSPIIGEPSTISSPVTPITPGSLFNDGPRPEAPPSLRSLDMYSYETNGANTAFKAGLEAFFAGRYDDARNQFQQAANQSHNLNDIRQEANSLVRLGVTCRHLKDYADARSHLLAARALYERLGGDYLQEKFQCARHLARVEEDIGNLQAALEEYLLLKAASQQAGFRTQQAWCSYYLGHVYNRMKRYEEALPNLNEAVNMSKEMGNMEIEAFAAEECGYTAEREGHTKIALGCYQEALKLFMTHGQGKWVDNEARVRRRISQLRGKPDKWASKKPLLRWLSKRSSNSSS